MTAHRAPDAPDAVDGAPGESADGPLPPPAAGQCELWWIRVVPREDWAALLDEAEQKQAAGFAAAPDRAVFTTSRAAQRLIGARYLGLDPLEVRIDRTCVRCGGPSGRPSWADNPHGLDYSVSRARSWVVVAIVGRGTVGVRVEDARAAAQPDYDAQRAFTQAERALIAAVPPPVRTAEQLRLWTRKRAAVKIGGDRHALVSGLKRVDVSGATAVADPAPEGWPATPIHLLDVPSRDAHGIALASTEPIHGVLTPSAREQLARVPLPRPPRAGE